MRIVGAVMAKDEAHHIAQCIGTMLEICDHVVLADTGSTDDTCAVAAAAAATWIRDRKPEIGQDNVATILTIVHLPWQGFAATRNALMAAAKEGLAAVGGPPDWLMVLDADMYVEQRDGTRGDLGLLVRGQLEAGLVAAPDLHGGLVETRVGPDGSTMSRRPVFLRADQPWTYVGDIHESVTRQVGTPDVKDDAIIIEGLVVWHPDEAGAARRWSDDVAALLKEREKDPENPDWPYYLGQAYKSSGDRRRAIKWYRRALAIHDRHGVGEDNETRWFLEYSIALLEDQAEGYARVFAARPWRAEPMYALAGWHRRHGDHVSALRCAALACELPEPREDVMYVERDVYLFGALWEAAHAAAALGQLPQALQLLDELQRRDEAAFAAAGPAHRGGIPRRGARRGLLPEMLRSQVARMHESVERALAELV